MAPPRNLLNAELVTMSFGDRPILDRVSVGIASAERIGVVGRNGAGKSTLLDVLTRSVEPLSGRVSVTDGTDIGVLRQYFDVDPQATVLHAVVGSLPTHEWASVPRVREVLASLVGGVDHEMLNRRVGDLSGGERRRVQLAALLVADHDLLVLDEPTNHLDVEAVDWLARHLRELPSTALLVVTHDRWFLDAVTDRTWEVVGGSVEEYDGGYSAYVLAKAERMRQAAAADARRNNLIRKELAWLRRGPPARTSKPRFRVEAANALIADEPMPRDTAQLLAFSNARLGRTAFELDDVSVELGDKRLLEHVTWGIGPGDRIGVLGPNGVGKTTLVRTMLGELPPVTGRVREGSTVRVAYLSQHLDELEPTWRLLEAVEDVATRVDLGKGRELTASQLCEQLGFGADAQWTLVGDLSGGERRRLQLTRLLMGAPNVLVLDEPTNDFDVETLTALEDLLDGFVGSLLVITHDRYFLERVCDDVVALMGDGSVRHLPGGVDEYLASRAAMRSRPSATSSVPRTSSAAEQRQREKDLARIERQVARLEGEEERLHQALAENAADYPTVAELDLKLRDVRTQREILEEEWLELASLSDHA